MGLYPIHITNQWSYPMGDSIYWLVILCDIHWVQKKLFTKWDALTDALPSRTSPSLISGFLHGTQDITVIFDDEAATEIRTHSAVLMLASPVFHKMLTQEMREKKNRRIVLPGKNPAEFQVLLEFLQPGVGRLRKVSEQNVELLMRWCDEYCIESLHGECIKFIKKQPATVPRVLRAHRLGLEDYETSSIDTLLRAGEKDWKLCYDHPELVQKVLERSLANVKSWTPMNPPPPTSPARARTRSRDNSHGPNDLDRLASAWGRLARRLAWQPSDSL